MLTKSLMIKTNFNQINTIKKIIYRHRKQIKNQTNNT
jgi:hypothetical protein